MHVVYGRNNALAISQMLSRIALFVRESLTIIFEAIDPDSPPLFALTPFSHISTLHLSIKDLGMRLNPLTLASWLDAAVTSVVLEAGMTLQLSLTTIFPPHDRTEWDTCASGFVGGELLLVLAREHPEFRIRALLRDVTPERTSALKALHPGIEIVQGFLEDRQTIQTEAEKADIVINTASSDHGPSVEATLEGLEKNSAENPGKPPLYIHVSGCGIISDNVRGEKVAHVREWTDIGLRLKDCPQENTHLESDTKVVEAGTRTKNRVRTIILLPGQIYGIGRGQSYNAVLIPKSFSEDFPTGLQKTTLWVRIFLDIAKNVGYCGTWGPGENSQSNVHVRDMARAVTTVLNAALEGKAGEGADGLCDFSPLPIKIVGELMFVIDFTVSSAPLITYHDWSTKMGDGSRKERGAKPFPLEITELWGHYGWSLLGSNQRARPDRLSALGWVPEQSLLSSIHEEFPAMVEAALEDYAIKAKFAFR
ncbi:NAD(P)-binding protein [Mycena venus]|uniref:NAD(P)-binding protein n=1 Tax=Mycena venus TaxID=2733690 RepID=A0A8H7CD93_9AGAR|nr:NAD(P)-binding protein [Mycena venus]